MCSTRLSIVWRYGERAVTGKQATEGISTCRIHSNYVVYVAIKTIADGGFVQRRLRNG